MQPKLIAASIAAAFAALSTPVHAGPLDALGGNEVKALAYVSLPFGGVSRKQEAPILGFSVNHIRSDPQGGFSYSPSLFQQPASAVRSLMDVRFNMQKQNWDRFRVGGVDALTYETRLNADGTTEKEATGVSTEMIVAGVVIGVVVINDATKNDKNDDPPAASSGGCVGAGCGGGI
jgi:hypothetical protein